MRTAALALLACCAPVCAQTVVTSASPESVSVTVYRDPDRGADTALDLRDLTGFALITETRTLDLPPGAVTIRFEGVASGIEPATSIVVGAPLQEKNRDRQLLSQRGLLDAFTGQAVTIRRTNRASGEAVEEAGTIRSGPDGLILQTRAGFEAVHCTGLHEALLFPHVPANLAATPTLSVTTRNQPGGRTTITLSYIARQFDWQANYVGELSADARRLDLLGWMTMASADETSFSAAKLYAVAGKPATVEDDDDELGDAGALGASGVDFQCWPAGDTSSGVPPAERAAAGAAAPIAMRMAPVRDSGDVLEAVIVTGMKRAVREDLGDLKLYRVPFDVTVAARSQKQIAFLSKPAVAGEMVYRSRIGSESPTGEDGVQLLYRVRNLASAGLGEALPAGQVALFQTIGGRRSLVGQATLDDKAVGEDVELELERASNVSVEVAANGREGDSWEGATLTVRNANPWPIRYEAEFQSDDDVRFEGFDARVSERRGRRVWRVTVPAHGWRTLDFRGVYLSR